MAYAQILQRLLQRFFMTMGRAPGTPKEWSKLRRQAMELSRKEEGIPSITSKTTLQDLITGPHTDQRGRTWDFSQKKGEVIPFPDKGIRSLIKKGDVTVGKAPKTTPEHLKAKKDRGILLRDADEDIARIKRENKEAVERFKKKYDKIKPDEPDKFQFGGIAPLVGEPSYAANFYDDRTPMEEGGRIGLAGGGLLKKFIEKLFIKASNDIRLGRGKWKGLDQKQRIVQHDNLTKKVTEFQKSGKTVGLEEYFGVDPHTAFIGARDKVKRQGIIKDFPEATGKKVDKNRKLYQGEELDEYIEILDPSGEAGIVEEGMTVGQLDDMVVEHKAYMDDMYQQYKSGALDKYVKPEELEKQRLFRQKKIDNVLAKAYDEVFYQKPLTGDYKYDADVLSDSIAEQLGKGEFTDLPQTHQTQIYNTALKRVTQDMKMKTDMDRMRDIEQKIELDIFDIKGRKPNASGGPVDQEALIQMYLEEGLSYEEAVAAAQSTSGLDMDISKKAEGGIMREGHIFGGSAGLKGMWKQMMKGISERRGGEPIKRLFPTLSSEERALEKLVMGTPEQKAFREGEAAHKLEGIDLIINRLKHDKKIIERKAKNKKIDDPGLNFLMKKLEETAMPDIYGPHLKKYIDIDKDILQMENIKKNLIMKDRKLNAYGGRIGYAGGGQAGLPAVTLGLPQGPAMQQPQMPGGPQPTGIPGGTIVAQNQMQQAPWMGSQMQQPGGMPHRGMPQRGMPQRGMPQRGMPRPQPGGMPRPMAAQGGRIGFGVGGFNKARRAFLKKLAGFTGAGVAAGTGLLKFGSKAAPKAIKETTEVIARGADGMPKYIYDLIEVVKAKGTRDVIEGFKKSDYSTVHSYKGVDVIEHPSGATTIKKQHEGGGTYTTDEGIDESFDGITHEIEMEIRKGDYVKNKAGKMVQTPDEYVEYTARPDMDGKMKDVEEYIDEMDHLDLQKIADEGSFLTQKRNRDKVTKIKKASGGLAYALGE